MEVELVAVNLVMMLVLVGDIRLETDGSWMQSVQGVAGFLSSRYGYWTGLECNYLSDVRRLLSTKYISSYNNRRGHAVNREQTRVWCYCFLLAMIC